MAAPEVPALTSLSHGAGCGCKLAAADIGPVVAKLPAVGDPRLLVGPESADDAAVVRLSEHLAIVQSVDFFTPIVDDPYDFGRIAAANALSDLYAMGARPLCALNLVAFPLERLGPDVLAEIMRGGQETVLAAGAFVAGGHSIDDPEPKYGLAVTGTVDPEAMVTNAGAREGDVLYLTKPLGVGAVTTAAKRGEAEAGEIDDAVATMAALNADASTAAVAGGVHAMTDVTGFGLLGHLHELTAASGLAAEVAAEALPALAGAERILRAEGGLSGGARRNAEHAAEFATFDMELAPWRRALVNDPTTSGGLLVAAPPDAAMPGWPVGRLIAGPPGRIAVHAAPFVERPGPGGPTGLQNRGAAAAPRSEGSTPSPLRRL